jgi:hypothetical protein
MSSHNNLCKRGCWIGKFQYRIHSDIFQRVKALLNHIQIGIALDGLFCNYLIFEKCNNDSVSGKVLVSQF